jgi:hypothetical protein
MACTMGLKANNRNDQVSADPCYTLLLELRDYLLRKITDDSAKSFLGTRLR